MGNRLAILLSSLFYSGAKVVIMEMESPEL